MKDVNVSTSNEFHDWQRENLPSKFVIQDIDTWSILISDSEENFKPLFLVELKRSFIDINKWEPFESDKNNYLAIYELAKKADLPLYIFYFKKGVKIVNSGSLAIFKVSNMDKDSTKWITFKKIIMAFNELKEKFPNFLDTVVTPPG